MNTTDFLFRLKPFYRMDGYNCLFAIKVDLLSKRFQSTFYIDSKTFQFLECSEIISNEQQEEINDFLKKNRLRIFFDYLKEMKKINEQR